MSFSAKDILKTIVEGRYLTKPSITTLSFTSKTRDSYLGFFEFESGEKDNGSKIWDYWFFDEEKLHFLQASIDEIIQQVVPFSKCTGVEIHHDIKNLSSGTKMKEITGSQIRLHFDTSIERFQSISFDLSDGSGLPREEKMKFIEALLSVLG